MYRMPRRYYATARSRYAKAESAVIAASRVSMLLLRWRLLLLRDSAAAAIAIRLIRHCRQRVTRHAAAIDDAD